MAKQEPYPSTLSDKEWKLIRPLLPVGKLGRPARYSPRVMIDAILYVVRSGCTWRMMPHEFPHWRLVYYYFAKWHAQGVWEKINLALVGKVRVRHSKKAPTAAIIESQSVKMASQPGERGFDAGKKIMGRKRHILVDTLGLMLGVRVHPANIQDRDGARLLEPFLLFFGRLKVIFVDGGYAGQLTPVEVTAPAPQASLCAWRLSNVPKRLKAFICCQNDGWLNAPSPGWVTSAGSQRTTKSKPPIQKLSSPSLPLHFSLAGSPSLLQYDFFPQLQRFQHLIFFRGRR